MAELIEEPLPKGVKRIGPVASTEPVPKGVKVVGPVDPSVPKGVKVIGPVDPNKAPVERRGPPPGVKLGKADFEANKEYIRLNDVRQKLRIERQKELAIELKGFAKTKADELTATKPPPEWRKEVTTNERGDQIEVMKRSTESLQHDLAVKTYQKIAEMNPEEVGDFVDGFLSSGKKGLDVEGTARLLPFVGAFLDYNESKLLNDAAMAGKPAPSAQALLTAKNVQLQMHSLIEKGRWEDVGALMNQMVPFAVEFMVTRGAGGSASAGLRGAAAEVIRDAPMAARALKGTAAAAKSGLGSSVIQTTLGAPRVLAGAEARKTPELGGIDRDEEGKLVVRPVSEEAKAKAEGTLEATLKAFGSGVVENFTERFGGFADDLYAGIKARGLGISKKALEKTLSSVGENGMTALQKKAREVGIDSFLGEVLLEEVPSQIGTSLVTGDELNLDFDQLLNLGIAAGIPGGVVTASAVPRAVGYLFNKIPPAPGTSKSGAAPVTQTDKYEVTGDILIQKASTGKHTAMAGVDVIEYATGLVNKRTGAPIIVQEINDGESIIFQTPEGEFVGTSAEDVANQVQRAGLPSVSPGQIAQAEAIIGAGGYNKASFQRALVDVFHYPKRQAEIVATISDRMVQTIAKRQKITPDQAYQKIKLAKGTITEKGEIIEYKKAAAPSKADETLASKLKMPVSKLMEAEIDEVTGEYKNPPFQESGGEAKGAYVSPGEGKGLIFAFAGADVTTALHELSHHYEYSNVMTAAEKKAIESWSGHKAGTVEFSEAFARGFETFLKNGKVSSNEMKDAFSKFRKYLTDVIKAWIDTGRPLSTQMEEVYRDMLGEPAVASKAKEAGKPLATQQAKEEKKVEPKQTEAKPVKTKKKASNVAVDVPAKPEKGTKQEVAAVHKTAVDAKVDIETKDFAQASENLTGERHLDNMTAGQLKVVDTAIKEKAIESTKPQAPAASVDKEPQKNPTPAKDKGVKKKAAAKPASAEKAEPIQTLTAAPPIPEPAKSEPRAEGSILKVDHPEMENPVYSAIVHGQDKFIQRMETNEGHRWYEVAKNKDGSWSIVDYGGDVMDILGDNKTEAVERLQRRYAPATPESLNGDTSVEQPAMKPAKVETPSKFVSQIKKEPKKEAPKAPKRTVVNQPSEDAQSTSELVVEALKGLDFVPDTMKEMTELVASLDEEGRPLGPAKAFAVIHQMQTDGFIKIDGKRITPLFQKKPSEQQADKDYITNAQKQVLSDIDKAVAAYDPVANMKANGNASFRDWVKSVEAGAKGDAETIKTIAQSLNISIPSAKTIYDNFKGNGLVLDVKAKGFLEALLSGRGHALSQYGSAFTHLVKQFKSINKLSDTVNDLNFLRIVSLLFSFPVSLVQTAKTLALGNLESEFIAPRMRAFGNWFADKMRAGVTHRSAFIRVVPQIMQGLYRGLTYTTAGVEAQAKLRGGINEGNVLAQRLMEEMYNLVDRDSIKLARVHAVLDPEVYAGTAYEGVTAAALGADEALLLQVLRDNMVLLHDHSFARGYISEETYIKHKEAGGYFGREYEEIVNRQMFGDEVDDAFGAVRGDFSIYTKRKDFKEIDMTIEKDPVFIAAKRIATAVTNQAVTDYGDYIGDVAASKVITYSEADFEKMQKDRGKKVKGFTQLRGSSKVTGIYGALTNRYVPNYIAYDFRGFFLTSRFAQSLYDVAKSYDRLWVRKEMKKLLTVYNPAVLIGNQASNYTFAFINNVDLFNFNIMLSEAKTSIKEKDAIYHELLSAGVIGTNVTTNDVAPLRKKQEKEQLKISKPSLARDVVERGRKIADAITKSYSESDDKAKIAAYRVKTEVQGKSKEQAITEVLSGFQNYQSVGMYYDIGSKVPIFGNAFSKFTGDVLRITASSIAYRPLTTAAYLGSIVALQSIASGASGEDEERRAAREGRPFQPRIPFTKIPLTFKFGGVEINLARYLSPFTLYDRGEATQGMWNTFTELLPVDFYVSNGPGKEGYWKFSDPVIGWMCSLFYDKDFRGMSISNPTKTADSHERMLNQAEYFVRSFGFLPTTAGDMYRIIMNGQDYYGRNRSEWQRMLSIVVRVEEFNDPEIRKSLVRQITDLHYNVERIHDKANKLYRDGEKELLKIKNNTTITDQQRARLTMAEYTRIQKSIIELKDEYVKANKALTDAMSYDTELVKHLNETAKPTASQP